MINSDVKSYRAFLSEEDINKTALYMYTKRLIDLSGALTGLIILSPLLIIIAVIIKVESKGPILFSQFRVGKDGKEFKMLKFRSMVLDAEKLLNSLKDKNEVEGPIFKIKDDPRVTKVGKFIRKTSVDELPQLINVLRGEMSLVGPRPPLPHEVEQYSEYHKQRLAVTPGCTGLWQVSGRSNLSFDDMVKLDLQYIKERSILYDFKLILKTIKIMVKPDGAY